MKANNSTRKYFALVILAIVSIAILYLLKPFMIPIFTALILAILTYPMYKYFRDGTKSEVLGATLVILAIIFIFIIPLMFVGGTMLSYINNFEISASNLEQYETALSELVGVEVSITKYINDFGTYLLSGAKDTVPKIVGMTSSFLMSLFIMFFVLFYLLIGKDMFVKEIIWMLPFSKKNSEYLLGESVSIVKAVFIGQLLTAIIQGLLGMFAFLIIGLEGAFILGIIMIILSIIPVVGAFLIWIPVGILLIATGSVYSGVFVLLWGGIVISQVDNLIRPKLVNKFADIHPLETFIGIFIGIAKFNFIGIVLGPLIISQFKLILKVYKKEYSKEK